MLTAEQGVGDVIQLLRFVPQLRALGAGGVILHATDSLADLLATCPGVDRVVGRARTPDSTSMRR